MASKLLRWFAYVWLGLVAVSILLGIAGAFTTQPFWDAVRTVQGWFSPFNVANYFVILLVSLPGIGAYMLAERPRIETTALSASDVAEATKNPEALINAYKRTLEENLGMYIDEAKLPAPREAIKQVLILTAKAHQAAGGLSGQTREALRTAYMSLANFVPKAEVDQHLRFEAAISDAQDAADLVAAARAIAEAPGDDSEREAREARHAAEARQLLTEFDKAVRG